MSPEPEKGPNFRYQQLVAPIALYPDALVPRYSPPPPTPEEIAGARGLASRRAPPRPFLGRNDGAAAARPCRATHEAARLSENLGYRTRRWSASRVFVPTLRRECRPAGAITALRRRQEPSALPLPPVPARQWSGLGMSTDAF